MNIIVSCGNSGKIERINKQQIMGVQLADGRVVTAQSTKVNERSDEVIRSFVEKWSYLSFTHILLLSLLNQLETVTPWLHERGFDFCLMRCKI